MVSNVPNELGAVEEREDRLRGGSIIG